MAPGAAFPPILILLLCILGTLLALLGERRRTLVLAGVGKMLAASSYVAIAVLAGAAETSWGRIMLAAMALCWLGDLFLVSHDRRWFLYGLMSFLAGHIAYSVAFVSRGLDLVILAPMIALLTVFAWRTWRWLQPHVETKMRLPVWAYLLAICTMMVLAVSTHVHTANAWIAIGALLFVVSDLAVARQRFVREAIANRMFGLPLYFAAQVSLAVSVAGGTA